MNLSSFKLFMFSIFAQKNDLGFRISFWNKYVMDFCSTDDWSKTWVISLSVTAVILVQPIRFYVITNFNALTEASVNVLMVCGHDLFFTSREVFTLTPWHVVLWSTDTTEPVWVQCLSFSLTAFFVQGEDDVPPRPPLPQLYSPDEHPPAVPPLPRESTVIRHTSVRGLKRQSDERKRDREICQYSNGDSKVLTAWEI